VVGISSYNVWIIHTPNPMSRRVSGKDSYVYMHGDTCCNDHDSIAGVIECNLLCTGVYMLRRTPTYSAYPAVGFNSSDKYLSGIRYV